MIPQKPPSKSNEVSLPLTVWAASCDGPTVACSGATRGGGALCGEQAMVPKRLTAPRSRRPAARKIGWLIPKA